MADFYRDAAIDSDRDIIISADKDIELTESEDHNIEQSLGITASKEMKDLISRPITGRLIANIEGVLIEELAADPQMDGVLAVDIVTINKSDGNIEARVIMDKDEDFVISVNV